MAIITGGLHGRARGNVNGIIYGAARTRLGKVVTAREYVIPSDPKKPAQIIQRRKFKGSLYAVRHLGATLWTDDFNRAIGQLPGFQSMMSIILFNTDELFKLAVPPETPLGNLHYPATFTVVTGELGPKSIDIDWSSEIGLNGTIDDDLVVFGIGQSETDPGVREGTNFVETAKRSIGTLSPDTSQAEFVWIIGTYFKGAGIAEGLLSPCNWYEVTSLA